jgi:hypothetical protein
MVEESAYALMPSSVLPLTKPHSAHTLVLTTTSMTIKMILDIAHIFNRMPLIYQFIFIFRVHLGNIGPVSGGGKRHLWQ